MNAPLRRILILAGNTFREASRTRAFVSLLIASLALILSSLLLAELAVLGQEQRIVTNFGLFFISFMGVVISITTGVILVYKELERKTIYTVLARPVHRWEYLLGKYLGMLLIILVTVLFLSLVWLGVLLVHDAPLQGILAKAVLLIFAELAILSAVALFFSSFSTPILSGVLTLAFFLAGRVVHLIEEMLASASRQSLFVKAPAMRPLGEALARVFPDLSIFHVGREILLGREVPLAYVAQALGYAGTCVVVLLVAAVLFFRRRDFL
ncbi:MAG: ABC transporter permease [Deltaproteobacteria bacterium]|nr:ABC transporter permease [Deltaproteobacteria bacterium]